MTFTNVEKPAEGSWTASVGLDFEGFVDYEDSISPEFYEAEKQAIFKRCWLNVGRVEQVPRVGSYFTKELAAADTSIIVVRGKDKKVRAFHNMCRHRGNKLVWTDFPDEEETGACRQFSCKYHGWRYDLDGALTFITQEEDFPALDKSELGLAEVNCDVWEGFIFVNLARNPRETLQEFLGEMADGLEGYPFHEMTQVFRYRAEVNSNWKLFMDTFAEFYHAPTLHGNQNPNRDPSRAETQAARALHYRVMGPHRVATAPGAGRYIESVGSKPIDKLLRSGLQGPWDMPLDIDVAQFPTLNPTNTEFWGLDSCQFFPNFVILVWERGWYLTYHYWPTSVDSHIFEGALYFVPPRTASERLAQEATAVTFKEFALQDANTLEATHTMLKSRAVTKFPLSDEELLVRHLHHEVKQWVQAYNA